MPIHSAQVTLSSLLLGLFLLGLPSVATPAELADQLPRVRVLFPTADRLETLPGPPPYTLVRAGETLLGYALLTSQVKPIPAYSGKPINALVGFDLDGRIRGVEIVEHQEPILVVGVSEEDLHRFTGQYADIPVSNAIRVGGNPAPERTLIDGITGATITTMVINSSVTQSVHLVAQAAGLLVKTEAGEVRFVPHPPPDPLWQQIWRERNGQIAGLAVGLGVLLLILHFQDWLARHPTLLGRLRTLFLIYTLVSIGWLAMGQLSVVNVLTFIAALREGFRWEGFLVDPVLFLLWSFVALTLLLWGRGVYCGWLCPFGALQELLFRLGRRARLPAGELPDMVHERLLGLKYMILIGLFGVSLQSLATAERLAEVEPFKTLMALHLNRAWPFVTYVLVLLLIGLFVRKFFCRYLCPLGAALTFPGRLRIFDWLRRRRECGRPCQICALECEARAIRPTGEINDVECH
jgi:NosR/NirI family nitrous oxide reductase transcriptional regulator